jgi:hypothetical protein
MSDSVTTTLLSEYGVLTLYTAIDFKTMPRFHDPVANAMAVPQPSVSAEPLI